MRKSRTFVVLIWGSLLIVANARAQQHAGDVDDGSPDAESPGALPIPPPASPSDAGQGPPDKVQRDELAERVTELEDRLDSMERMASVHHIRMQASYRTMLASYWYEGPSPEGTRNPDGTPQSVNRHNLEQWMHRLEFDVRAEPTQSVRFTGRLSMFKRYGSNVSTAFPQDFSASRVPSDTSLRVDRAWLDWFWSDRVALSLGRISYAGGPPNDLKENRGMPDATWGQQMVDGEYETIDLTVRLTDWLLARGFYASWAFPRQDDLFSSFLFLTDGTENLRLTGGNVDLRIPALGDSLIQLGYFAVPRFRPFTVPIPSPNPPANPSNAPPPFDGSLVFPSELPDSLGSFQNASILALFKDIGGAGIDLFASGAIGWLKPNGEAISYPLGPTGESVPVLQLSSADAANHTTYFAFAGGRFTMPFGGAVAPKIGVEYNYGSRYLISFATPAMDLTNKLANRGQSYELYYIQPFNEALFLRTTFARIETDYQGSGGFFGPAAQMGGTAAETHRTLQTLNFALSARL